MNVSTILAAGRLAAAPKSQEVTDWGARIGWVVAVLLFITLLYWLMRQGWKWRGTLQGDLPELPQPPAEPGEPLRTMAGRYHGSTTAGQWLDRIVAHGLGVRSRVELTLTPAGLDVRRPGAQDFFIPLDQLRDARLDKGIAGKVLTEGGLLVVVWQHGERLLDSGFRSDRSAEHPEWVASLQELLRAREARDAGEAERSADAEGPAGPEQRDDEGQHHQAGTAPATTEKGAR